MKHLIVFLSVIILSSCASKERLTTSSYTGKGINFSHYRGYSFLRTLDTSFVNQGINKADLSEAIAKETTKQLSKKGLYVNNFNPDCFFRYNFKVRTTYETGSYSNVAYSGQTYSSMNETKPETEKLYMFGSNNKPVIYSETFNIDTLREGTFVIEMIDAKTDSVIWYSKAESRKEINEIDSLKDIIKRIIPKMFKSFPK